MSVLNSQLRLPVDVRWNMNTTEAWLSTRLHQGRSRRHGPLAESTADRHDRAGPRARQSLGPFAAESYATILSVFGLVLVLVLMLVFILAYQGICGDAW